MERSCGLTFPLTHWSRCHCSSVDSLKTSKLVSRVTTVTAWPHLLNTVHWQYFMHLDRFVWRRSSNASLFLHVFQKVTLQCLFHKAVNTDSSHAFQWSAQTQPLNSKLLLLHTHTQVSLINNIDSPFTLHQQGHETIGCAKSRENTHTHTENKCLSIIEGCYHKWISPCLSPSEMWVKSRLPGRGHRATSDSPICLFCSVPSPLLSSSGLGMD